MIQSTKRKLDIRSVMSLGHLFVIVPMWSKSIGGKVQQPNVGRMTKGKRPLRNEGMGHSFRKEPRAAGVLLRVEVMQNVEEAIYKC